MNDSQEDDFVQVLTDYRESIRLEFETAISGWQIELENEIVHAVVGGLLARQCILATEFAMQPELWNFSLGPLFIRSMVELYINFEWILDDANKRSRDFYLYGMGQAKLALEYARSLEHFMGGTSIEVKAQEVWLNSQRHEMFTDVNVGLWSGKTLRDMAAEAKIPDSFILYSTLAGTAHGSWDHVLQIYLEDPLANNSAPSLPEQSPNLDFLISASRICKNTFDSFLQFTEQDISISSFKEIMTKVQEFTGDKENE